MEKNIFNYIKSIKSTRNFELRKIKRQTIEKIIDCARLAAAGDSNDQPLRINIVTHPTVKQMIAELLEYEDGVSVSDAYVNFIIFLDLERSINRDSDLLSVGAFIQNLILSAHGFDNLGTLWISKVSGQKEKINEIFKLNSLKYELISILAMGAIDKDREKTPLDDSRRRRPEELVDWF